MFVVLTVSSVHETPLSELSIQSSRQRERVGKYCQFNNEDSDVENNSLHAGLERPRSVTKNSC